MAKRDQACARRWRKAGRLGLLLLAVYQPASAAPHLNLSPTSPGSDRQPHGVELHAGRTRGFHRTPAPERPRWPAASATAMLDEAVAADPLATDAQREQFVRAARQRLAEARAQSPATATEWAISRSALTFLHARILTGRYDPTCARLRSTLEDGTYNCLTATYWYLALCRDLGIRAVAVATPGHVAVRVWLQEAPWDVETTDRNWHPKASHESNGVGQELTDRALLGRIHYNLGIEFARSGDFEHALQATRRSCQLDPQHAEARVNLLATLNNWSVELVRRGEYDRAEALIAEGLDLEPSSELLRRSDAYLRQQRQSATW